jgi:hypothetical protein
VELSVFDNTGEAETVAKQVLEALGEATRLLREHAVRLERSSIATKAEPYLGVVSYRNGTFVEAYVDAELISGISVCWSIDITWNSDSWTFDASLYRQAGDRQETIMELPTETVNDFTGFLVTLKRVVNQLLALEIPEELLGRRR